MTEIRQHLPSWLTRLTTSGIKNRFEAEGIPIPYPHRVLLDGEKEGREPLPRKATG